MLPHIGDMDLATVVEVATQALGKTQPWRIAAFAYVVYQIHDFDRFPDGYSFEDDEYLQKFLGSLALELYSLAIISLNLSEWYRGDPEAVDKLIKMIIHHAPESNPNRKKAVR